MCRAIQTVCSLTTGWCKNWDTEPSGPVWGVVSERSELQLRPAALFSSSPQSPLSPWPPFSGSWLQTVAWKEENKKHCQDSNSWNRWEEVKSGVKSPRPVFNDPLDNVICGEIVPTVYGLEYPPLLRLLRTHTHTFSKSWLRPSKLWIANYKPMYSQRRGLTHPCLETLLSCHDKPDSPIQWHKHQVKVMLIKHKERCPVHTSSLITAHTYCFTAKAVLVFVHYVVFN